jgi:hypothetical protein
VTDCNFAEQFAISKEQLAFSKGQFAISNDQDAISKEQNAVSAKQNVFSAEQNGFSAKRMDFPLSGIETYTPRSGFRPAGSAQRVACSTYDLRFFVAVPVSRSTGAG